MYFRWFRVVQPSAATRSRRIEDADFASGFDERAEQSEERTPAASKPVIDDADLDALARALGQKVDETAPDRIP
jgi:hypothetical protein